MAGMANSVRNDETIRPPETAMPSGCSIDDPEPSPIAMGSMPKMVVSVVIRMGWKRSAAVASIAERWSG